MPNNQQYPIVLAHGIARFDALTDSFLWRINLFMWDLSLAFDRLHYFKGIASYLIKHDFEVYKTSVGFADAVEVRAEQLAAEIRSILAKTGHEKVHIIGHSMGGLDARQMLFQDRAMAEKVASVTTIGTPHNGTSFADFGLANGGAELIEAVRPFINLDGILTLTRAKRQAFNDEAREWEAQNPVFYQVYAGSQAREKMFAPLQLISPIIFEEEGANDGLVSHASQLWTDSLVTVDGTTKTISQQDFPRPVDHLNEVGWWDIQESCSWHWWRVDKWLAKRRFETAVKEAYLAIAREVTTAVSPAKIL